MVQPVIKKTSHFNVPGQAEISVTAAAELFDEADRFITFLSGYVRASGRRISAGETLAYGYWVVRFTAEGDVLSVWEYTPDATQFVAGATLTLTYWRDQHQLCDRVGAAFAPPRPDTLVVVSPDVFTGGRPQGVRYPSPSHMSGWWITTDAYDGNVESLQRHHAYHLTARRPDLVSLLALPFGYRFDLTQGEDVWFDSAVASAPP